MKRSPIQIWTSSVGLWTLTAALGAGCGGGGDDAGDGVDVTGYLTVENVRYSATEPLSETDVDILVIGQDGALEKAGGTLTVTNLRTDESRTADATDGQFAVWIPGRLDDQLELRYDLDGYDEALFDLTDRLDQLETPIDCLPCSGQLVADIPGDGQVTVNIDFLESPQPPYLVINTSTGFNVLEAGAGQVVIPGASGDEICLVRVAGTDTSPTLCGDVP